MTSDLISNLVKRHLRESLLNKECLWDLLALCVLVCFAITQPVLDILSRHPEFFVAWGAQGKDIVLFAAYLGLFLALQFIVPVEIIAGVISKYLRLAVHFVLIAVLFMLIVLPLVKASMGDRPMLTMAVGATAGLAFAVGYFKVGVVKKLVRILTPVVLIFPLLFIFSPSISSLVWPGETETKINNGTIANPVPIVFILFDEFSVNGLLDGSRNIDAVNFPNFAALASNAAWFSNTTTASTGTTHAVPAILTGNTVKHHRMLPLQRNYPVNLFSLLGDTYDMRVVEGLTQLCGETLCPPLKLVSSYELLKEMLGDAGYVLLHQVLPPAYTTSLPRVDQGWRNFQGTQTSGKKRKWNVHKVADDAMKLDKKETFQRFVSGIEATAKPTLHFLHFLFPHRSYAYMPSGKRYQSEEVNRTINALWNSDQVAIDVELQRYMFQLGYADRMIGELVEHLKAAGMYDETLLIITSDHGIGYELGKHNRKLTKSNLDDLLSVPLFIKLPGADKGERYDWPVETVDILPTILDVLQQESTHAIDGHSLARGDYPAKAHRNVHDHAKSYQSFAANEVPLLDLPVDLPKDNTVVQRKTELFGSGLQSFYRFGGAGEYIGKALSDFSVTDTVLAALTVPTLDEITQYKVDNEISVSQVFGTLDRLGHSERPMHILMAANGEIVGATTSMRSLDDGKVHFSLYFPEQILVDGANEIEFFVVKDADVSMGELIKLKVE